MTTRQRYAGRGSIATDSAATSQAVNSDPQTPPNQAERRGKLPSRILELKFRTSDDFDTLFYCLVDRLESQVRDMIMDVDRTDPETLAFNWLDFLDIKSLLIELVTTFSYYVDELEIATGRSKHREGVAKYEAYWRERFNRNSTLQP